MEDFSAIFAIILWAIWGLLSRYSLHVTVKCGRIRELHLTFRTSKIASQRPAVLYHLQVAKSTQFLRLMFVMLVSLAKGGQNVEALDSVAVMIVAFHSTLP